MFRKSGKRDDGIKKTPNIVTGMMSKILKSK